MTGFNSAKVFKKPFSDVASCCELAARGLAELTAPELVPPPVPPPMLVRACFPSSKSRMNRSHKTFGGLISLDDSNPFPPALLSTWGFLEGDRFERKILKVFWWFLMLSWFFLP